MMLDPARPVLVVGDGPARHALIARAEHLGLAERVRFSPFVSDRVELARLYRKVACVVDPGPHETFGLVVLETAASAARVIACDETPAPTVAEGLIDTFTAGDVDLAWTLRRALAPDENLAAAAALAERSTWQRVFAPNSRQSRRSTDVAHD